MTASTLRALSTLLLATLITLSAAGQQRPKFRFAAGPKPGGGEVKVTIKENAPSFEIVSAPPKAAKKRKAGKAKEADRPEQEA